MQGQKGQDFFTFERGALWMTQPAHCVMMKDLDPSKWVKADVVRGNARLMPIELNKVVRHPTLSFILPISVSKFKLATMPKISHAISRGFIYLRRALTSSAWAYLGTILVHSFLLPSRSVPTRVAVGCRATGLGGRRVGDMGEMESVECGCSSLLSHF